jgi:hypothetical protein
MKTPTFPPSGDPREDQIKTKAGYVEYAVFANQGGGYFCGTCAAYRPVVDGQFGYCAGLKVPVVSYGCCNNWNIAPRNRWIAADGGRL